MSVMLFSIYAGGDNAKANITYLPFIGDDVI